MNWGFKAKAYTEAQPTASQDVGDIYVSPSLKEEGVFKAYIPKYLYKPPFGYPRADNVPLMRQLSKNGYIFSIIKTITDEVATADWDIVFKEDSERKEDPAMEEKRLEIKRFFQNPNRNKESWMDLRKMWVSDILEVDAGVFVKVFNQGGAFSQILCRDGGSFLKNPDIYGYIGNRDEYIQPTDFSTIYNNYYAHPDQSIKQYSASFGERAAYFQYGTAVSASVPVPFGRREIIYSMLNPRSDNLYGRSPIAILADVIMTLVYGSNYNLDFFMNNNMPEGIVQLLGAEEGEINSFRRRMEKQYRVRDESTGFMRKVAFKIPITGTEAKFIPFQMDPKTMQILEQQQWFYKLVLACFGVPADAMGFTENSNLATGQNQYKLYMRKSAKPIMALLKYRIDNEIINEFGEDAWENLEYKWSDYDLDEEIKKFSLYETQIRIGVKTPKMVAEEEGIDFSLVEETKRESVDLEKELYGVDTEKEEDPNSQEKKPEDSEKKEPDIEESNEPEEKSILDKLREIKLRRYEKSLDNTEMEELEDVFESEFTRKANKISEALQKIQ